MTDNHDLQEATATTGTKRKADITTSPARDQKAAKKQMTIEDSLGGIVHDSPSNPSMDAEMKVHDTEDEADKMPQNGNAISEAKEEPATIEESSSASKETEAVQESSQRENRVPSSILEKGVIYFFTRNRVSVDEAESVGDLQRTYFVLRPLPLGAKLGDGALPDSKNNRLFALPKKVFPKSHNDRFMAFVEKGPTTVQDLKDNFFKGSEYKTKTYGTRSVDPMTPVAEGVYAITRTQDTNTHLAYIITIPSDMGEVQDDLGLHSHGSFVISVKNPERTGPASASLPQKPDYPKEIIEEFRGLAWPKVKPKYLDYANVQILLIGEKLESAVVPTTEDQKHDRVEPREELERLEQEDEDRVENLRGDDSVFDDLRLSKDVFSEVPTTW